MDNVLWLELVGGEASVLEPGQIRWWLPISTNRILKPAET